MFDGQGYVRSSKEEMSQLAAGLLMGSSKEEMSQLAASLLMVLIVYG